MISILISSQSSTDSSMDNILFTTDRTALLRLNGTVVKALTTTSLKSLTKVFTIGLVTNFSLPLAPFLWQRRKTPKCLSKNINHWSKSSCAKEPNKSMLLAMLCCHNRPASTKLTLSKLWFWIPTTTSLTKFTSPVQTKSTSTVVSAPKSKTTVVLLSESGYLTTLKMLTFSSRT